MRGSATAIAALVLLGTRLAWSQCSDPNDHTLCVHHLTPAESTQFSTSDGHLSAFWSTWASQGNDSINMFPPDWCMTGSCNFVGGATDGQIVVKAAANAAGLYLLSVVQDNIWVDPANGDDFGADATDFYFATEDSATIATCTDCTIGLYSSFLTFSTQQFQTWMGGTSPPTGTRLAYYDPNLWTWTTAAYTWATLKSVLNIDIEVISIDATHKAQEWFFPWDRFGATAALVPGTALAGKRLGFSGGYNDKDGDNATPDCLRWAGGHDPWVGAYWGDMLLSADMPAVQAMSAVRGTALRGAQKAAARVLSSEYYTLSGQRLLQTGHQTARSGNLVLRVNRMADGSSVGRLVSSGK